MKNFTHADKVISVCAYISKLTKSRYVKSKVILNGVENDYISSIKNANLPGKFKTGRCHRLCGSKFSRKSLDFLESLNFKGHKHYLIGPSGGDHKRYAKYSDVVYMGPIFNRQRKMSIIKDFDVYFYDARMKEGASIAILESLACGVPVLCCPFGGNLEIVKHGVNGYFISDNRDAKKILSRLRKNPQKLALLKEQTLKDFDERLHIRHMLARYMKIFKRLL